jgi:hypothetical protein
MKKNILSIFFILYSLLFWSQAPQSFNYQGAARNAQGEPLANKAISLRVSILNNSVTAVSSYAEIHQVSTSAFGLFSIAVGTGTPTIGQFSLLDWSKGSKFIKVEMDVNGGNNYLDMGTSQLLSTPYAYVGIGTNSPLNPLTIETSSNGPENSRYLIRLKNKSSDYRSYAGIYFEGANVNSGFGSIGIHNDSYDGLGLGGKLSINSTAPNGLFLATQKGKIELSVGITSAGNKSILIDSTGSMGIGTANPTQKLEVKDGDIYLADVNGGVIMRSPNGTCYRMSVSDAGTPIFTLIGCGEKASRTRSFRFGDNSNDYSVNIHSLTTGNAINERYFDASTWTSGGSTRIGYTYFKFADFGISPSSEIIEAKLTLYGDTYFGNPIVLGHNYGQTGRSENSWFLLKVSQPFDIITTNWSNQPLVTDSIPLPASTSFDQNYTIDITEWVKEYVANPSLNYGFGMKMANTTAPYRSIVFNSGTSPFLEKRPLIEIKYK